MKTERLSKKYCSKLTQKEHIEPVYVRRVEHGTVYSIYASVLHGRCMLQKFCVVSIRILYYEWSIGKSHPKRIRHFGSIN